MWRWSREMPSGPRTSSAAKPACGAAGAERRRAPAAASRRGSRRSRFARARVAVLIERQEDVAQAYAQAAGLQNRPVRDQLILEFKSHASNLEKDPARQAAPAFRNACAPDR